MQLSRWLTPLRGRVLYIPRKFSTQNRPSETAQTQIQEEKFDFEDIKVLERIERRKPKIEPFMKNVYLSDFNKEMLDYPEILNKEESEDLDSRVQRLENILNNAEMSETDKQNAIKRTQIFGAPMNLTQGGLAMINTERIRYLETLSADIKLANHISDHWVCSGALKNGLTKADLSKILPDILSGDRTVALCTNERMSTSVNQVDLRTTATLKNNDRWYINGEKLCMYPDGYKLVLCRVENSRFKVMLVDPDASGVHYKEPCVMFYDTPATVLDQAPENTFQLSKTRLDSCVLSYSLLRRLIRQVERYVRGKFVSGIPFADLPLLRTKVSEAMLTIYTAESMAYLTAGLMDGYEDPDTDLEVAMCRSYIAERAVVQALHLLSIAGLESIKAEWTEPLEDLRALQMKHDSLDTLNIFIGLMALSYAGTNMHQEIKKMRNPFFNPGYIFKKIISNRHQASDDPKLTLYLEEQLHPSLRAFAQKLEYAVLRLKYGIEQVLGNYGNDVYLYHNDLERIAQAGTEVLAMTAVLGRASRAYCIGVQNAQVDMRLAATAAELSRRRVQQLVLDCEAGEYNNTDHHHKDIGMKILDGGSDNLVDRPTARVWW